jgi:hypothetical protein
MGRIDNQEFSSKGAFLVRKPILSILAISVLASTASADVTYEEQTTMGGIMQMMGMGKPTKSTTRVSGDFMRTDSGDEATITDLAGEKIITLNTKKKTYSVMTFAEMKQKMQQAMSAAQGKKAEKPAQGTDVSMKTDAKVTDTGRTETIQGLACKQFLLELDMTMKSEKEQQEGTLSTLSEMWMAKDVPGSAEVNAFHRRMAEKIGTASIAQQFVAGGGQAPTQSFGADMQKMADEMKKMEGHAMRTVMYFGDPEAAKKEALGEKPAESEEGGGGIAAMLKKMQQGQGGQGGQGGGVMMKMTTETTKISTDAIDPKVFAVPADYKLVAGR